MRQRSFDIASTLHVGTGMWTECVSISSNKQGCNNRNPSLVTFIIFMHRIQCRCSNKSLLLWLLLLEIFFKLICFLIT